MAFSFLDGVVIQSLLFIGKASHIWSMFLDSSHTPQSVSASLMGGLFIRS